MEFIAQMHRAIEIAEIKYPKEDGWCHVWVFDHSSCHAAMAAMAAMADDARHHMEWESMENVLFR